MSTYALIQKRSNDFYGITRAQFVNSGLSKEVQTTLDNMQGVPLGITKKQRIAAVLTTCVSVGLLFGARILNLLGAI